MNGVEIWDGENKIVIAGQGEIRIMKMCDLNCCHIIKNVDGETEKIIIRKPKPVHWVEHHTRLGFSVVELLVVIGIIAVLLGLLLSGIQKVREVASLSRCKNNIKQMTLALQNYHDAHKHFPIGQEATDWQNEWLVGWTKAIAPYFEQENTGRCVIVNCPSRREPCTGVYFDKRNLWLIDYCAILPDGTNGIFISSRTAHVSLSQIPDGTSNTFCVGEKRLIPPYKCGWGVNNDDQGWINSGLDNDIVADARKDFGRDGPDDSLGTDWSKPGSNHISGMNVSFCDGSVRFVRYNIDKPVFLNMSNRRDGNTINYDY